MVLIWVFLAHTQIWTAYVETGRTIELGMSSKKQVHFSEYDVQFLEFTFSFYQSLTTRFMPKHFAENGFQSYVYDRNCYFVYYLFLKFLVYNVLKSVDSSSAFLVTNRALLSAKVSSVLLNVFVTLFMYSRQSICPCTLPCGTPVPMTLICEYAYFSRM